jgi:hypothetical protein
LFVVICALLLALATSPVLAQVIQSIALNAGDTLAVTCGTALTGVQTDSHSETLHCALVATP